MKEKKKTRKKKGLADIIIYVCIITVTVVCVLPFLYVLSISFTATDVYVPLEFSLIPKKFSLEVYNTILSTPDFLIALKNTVIVTIGGTIFGVFFTLAFAYGLTKKDLPFRRLLLGVVIFGLLFDVGMIPNYLNIRSLGLINSYNALILPALLTSYNVIIARSFIQGLPEELEDAARIDGCSYFSIFFRIVLPLAKASIATLALFIAVEQWNQYIKPLMYITDYTKRTIQVYVKTILVDASTTGLGVGDGNMALPGETIRMATIVLSMLPVMCIYPFVQKYFVKAIW